MAKKKVVKKSGKFQVASKFSSQVEEICQLKKDLVSAGELLERQSRYIEELRNNRDLQTMAMIKDASCNLCLVTLAEKLDTMNFKLMTELEAVGFATCGVVLSEVLKSTGKTAEITGISANVPGEVVMRSLIRIALHARDMDSALKVASERVKGICGVKSE